MKIIYRKGQDAEVDGIQLEMDQRLSEYKQQSSFLKRRLRDLDEATDRFCEEKWNRIKERLIKLGSKETELGILSRTEEGEIISRNEEELTMSERIGALVRGQ